MATPVVEVALVPKDEQATSIAQVIERMAANPAVDVAKLEKIIELQERLLAHQAKAAFDEAFVAMQQEMPVVDETAKGANDKAFYAPLEDVIKAVRPILSRHGFGLSHRTERLDNGRLRIVALLTHTQGHERQSTFDADPDVSGNKNAVQALGSTMSYGRRYTTLDVLGIVTAKSDTDGNAPMELPTPPAGYVNWLHDLECVSDDGPDALLKAWKESKPEYRDYRVRYQPSSHDALKKRAEKMATKGGRR